MEALSRQTESEVVESYWNELSSLSKTIKLILASRLTQAVLDEEKAAHQPDSRRVAKIKRRAESVPSDAELEARFANLEMPQLPENTPLWQDIIKANSGKTIKPIEKWL